MELTFSKSLARVAELADAQASGACARKGVRVQVPPRAPVFSYYQKSFRPSPLWKARIL